MTSHLFFFYGPAFVPTPLNRFITCTKTFVAWPGYSQESSLLFLVSFSCLASSGHSYFLSPNSCDRCRSSFFLSAALATVGRSRLADMFLLSGHSCRCTCVRYGVVLYRYGKRRFDFLPSGVGFLVLFAYPLFVQQSIDKGVQASSLRFSTWGSKVSATPPPRRRVLTVFGADLRARRAR